MEDNPFGTCIMNRLLTIGASFLAIALCVSPALATLIVDVGDNELQPSMADQVVEVRVSGGDNIDGMDFNARIGNGSDGNWAPKFTALDLLTGTIYASGNNGQYGDDLRDHVAIASTDVQAPVAGSGLIARLTIDTTGFTSGAWPLILSGAGGLSDPTVFYAASPPSATIIDGWIRIAGTGPLVPEPSTWVLLALGLLAYWPLRRFCRRG